MEAEIEDKAIGVREEGSRRDNEDDVDVVKCQEERMKRRRRKRQRKQWKGKRRDTKRERR